MSDEMVPEQWIQHQEIATLPIPYTSPDLMWHGEHSHKLILLSQVHKFCYQVLDRRMQKFPLLTDSLLYEVVHESS